MKIEETIFKKEKKNIYIYIKIIMNIFFYFLIWFI